MTAVTQDTDTERRAQLRDLARNWDDAPNWVALSRMAHPLLSAAQLRDTWDSYLGHVALDDGINGVPGATPCTWEDINDELTGPDHTEAARDEIAMRVAADEDALINGTAPGGAGSGETR